MAGVLTYAATNCLHCSRVDRYSDNSDEQSWLELGSRGRASVHCPGDEFMRIQQPESINEGTARGSDDYLMTSRMKLLTSRKNLQ